MKIKKTNNGFTLIEVLVAVVILALGLMGLAGLQAASLGNNQSAYHRSQASQLAYDVIDRIRSNPGNVITPAGSPDSYLQDGSYIPSCPKTNSTTPPCNSCSSPTDTCSTAQLAQKDLFEWSVALRNTIPNGVGQISQDPANNQVFLVTINWNDKQDATGNSSFVMRFRL